MPDRDSAQDERQQNFWLEYAETHAKLFAKGLSHTARLPDLTPPPPQQDTPLRHDVVLCAPHPDDEVLSGGLALRLSCENTRILVLAMTLGSKAERRPARREELAASCRVLGFDWALASDPLGLSLPAPETGAEADGRVAAVLEHFQRTRPRLVIMPHANDRHPTHEAAHRLALAALLRYSAENRREVLLAESEFWGAIADPNLLVGLTTRQVGRLVEALACHRGEIQRHPYHLLLPARLMDTVRRLGERNFSGGEAPEFLFGEAYRLSTVRCGRLARTDAFACHAPGTKLKLAALQAFPSQSSTGPETGNL